MEAPTVIDITSSQPQQIKQNGSHRLPTVTASQALQDLEDGPFNFIPCGIASLDARLAAVAKSADGGVERGKISEIWGPSGAGKTAIALQTAMALLRRGKSVTWIDAATTLSERRVRQAWSNTMPTSSKPSGSSLSNLKHVSAPTLSHLLAIILQPPTAYFQPETELLVIDELNHLVDLDYPRYQIATSNRSEQQKWLAGRRYAILGTLVSALNKLAVVNKLAIIVVNGCATRMRAESGLGIALVPGIGGVEWESGVYNRMVIFRDFNTRLIGLQKCQGRSLISRDEVGEPGHIIPFKITTDGAVEENLVATSDQSLLAQQQKLKSSPVKRRKRTADEIADSEGEDVDEFGWAETDEEVFAVEGLMGGGAIRETAADPG